MTRDVVFVLGWATAWGSITLFYICDALARKLRKKRPAKQPERLVVTGTIVDELNSGAVLVATIVYRVSDQSLGVAYPDNLSPQECRAILKQFDMSQLWQD